MTPEEKLISRIRDFCRGDASEKTPQAEEWAEQFADLCERLNGRLRRCADYLDRGLRSEAVYEARMSPPLVDTADRASFNEITQWRNYCKDFGLTVPPPLHLEIVDRLRTEQETESRLEPLLRKYRRLVHRGSVADRIEVLQQIRAADPENPVWRENLLPLQRQRNRELLARAEAHLEAGELEELERIYEELTSPSNLAAPSQEQLGCIADAVRDFRLQRGQRRATGVVEQLDSAVRGGDENRVAALVDEWYRLPEPARNLLDNEKIGHVRDAENWLQVRTTRRESREAVHELIAETRDLVNEPEVQPDDLRFRLRELRAAGDEVPPDLLEELENTLSVRRRHERVRRVLHRVRIAGAVVAILALLGVGSWWAYRQFAFESTADRVAFALDAGELARAEEALDDLEASTAPWIWRGNADVARLRRELRRRQEIRADRREAFTEAMAELEQVHDRRYAESEAQIERVVQDAEALADTSDQEERLRAWKNEYDLFRERRRQAELRRVEKILASGRAALNKHDRDAFASLGEEQRALQDVQADMRELPENERELGTQLGDRLATLRAEVDAWERDLESRARRAEQAEARRKELLESLPAALPDFDAFGELAREYVTAYPQDPFSAALQRLVNELPLFRDAAALAGFSITDLPLSEVDVRRVNRVVEQLQGGPDTLWRSDLNRCLTYTEKMAQVRRDLAALQALPTFDWNVFHIRPRGGDNWQPVYYPDLIRSRTDRSQTGEEVTRYWGEIYQYDAGEAKPWREHTSDVFPDGLNTRRFDVRIGDKPGSQLVPHGRFVRRLVAGARPGEPMDRYLMAAVGRLLDDEEMAQIPRALLIQKLVKLARWCAIDRVEPLETWFEETRNWPTHVRWYLDTEAVQTARDDIRRALQKLEDPQHAVDALDVAAARLVRILGAGVRWAGWVEEGSGGKWIPHVQDSEAVALWVVDAGGAGVSSPASFLVRWRREASGTWTEDSGQQTGAVLPMQPLFAPESPLGPGAGVEAPADAAGKTLPVHAWPAAWPLNLRTDER